MTNHRRRWFQLSLKSLFLLTLLVATFLAGYTLATKQAEAERQRAELEARLKAEATLRQPHDWTGSSPPTATRSANSDAGISGSLPEKSWP